ncbi:hypothetical protein DFQ26_009787 [Actinomortierella ambigua]|nr:hypothetical protein DFQ26_009787 [Actinomortierella ambigua]
MVRLAIFAALAALVVLSTTTALKFNYDVRILNRKEGGWLNSYNNPQFTPIVVEEKSAGDLGVWNIVDDGRKGHFFFNKGSRFPVVPGNPGGPVMTSAARTVPARVLLESVDVSAYRIKDIANNMYWTRILNQVYLRPLEPSDHNQIWEFRPQGFDDEFAFWEHPWFVLQSSPLLSLLSCCTFDYDVRILNRKSGGWLNGADDHGWSPIVVEETSHGDFGIWIIKKDVGEEEDFYFFFNEGSRYPVMPTAPDKPLMTSAARALPSLVRLEVVDVLAYHIKDTRTDLYWTRIRNEVYLRPRGASDDNQIWELQPAGFDEELAFWE